MAKIWKSKYFYGTKISDYGLEHGYVDYRTLAKAFNAVMANDLIRKTNGNVGYWEQISGGVDWDEIESLREKKNDLADAQYYLDENSANYDEVYSELDSKLDELDEQIAELEDYNPEIFQYFIVDYNGAKILQEFDEIVFYNGDLDLYLWGVTHYGTSWDYVLTDIKIELD